MPKKAAAKPDKTQERLRELALLNAAEHDGKSDAKAITGRFLAETPAARKDAAKILELAGKVCAAVNRLGLDKQRAEIKKLGLEEKKVEKAQAELPELPHATGRVVMRFAPNPNGPLSVGRARTALLNWWYAQRYRGDFILRFDDTDPKVKTPIKEAYDWILEDLKWLGVRPEKTFRASERLETYYKHAQQLVADGKAYICLCAADQFKRMKETKKACPHRDAKKPEQLAAWEDFFKRFKEGEAVVRLKTDVAHPDPAMREFPILRIVDEPVHPLSKARVWPLYDFASAIDDHEFGVTHVIRGTEFGKTHIKQGFIFDAFGWKYPENILVGKFLVAGVKSTTDMRGMIARKEISGWDDPRSGTLMSLRKRGFTPQAVAQFVKAGGLTKADVQVSLETLDTINRKLIDPSTPRYWFVADPIEVEIEGAEPQTIMARSHPEKKDMGTRTLHFKKVVLVSKSDAPLLKKGAEVRLKELFNIKAIASEGDKVRAQFTTKAVKADLQIIQWVPLEEKISLMLVMPDATERRGAAEKNIEKEVGKTVQFERVGFARIDKLNKDLIGYYAHK